MIDIYRNTPDAFAFTFENILGCQMDLGELCGEKAGRGRSQYSYIISRADRDKLYRMIDAENRISSEESYVLYARGRGLSEEHIKAVING